MGPIGTNPTVDPGYDPDVVAIVVKSIDTTVASISSLAASYEAPYSVFITERTIYDLQQAGYSIVKTPAKFPKPRSEL